MTLRDHNLKYELRRLQAITPRPEWKAAARQQLLMHVRATQEPVAAGARLRVHLFWHGVRRTVLQPASLLLVMLGFTLSSSLLVNAAYYSLPGDRLYGLKIGLESTQLAFARGNAKQAELQITFAKHRLNELAAIVARPSTSPEVKQAQVAETVLRLKDQVTSAQQQVRSLPEQGNSAFSLALAVDSDASELAASLNRRAKTMPPDFRAGIQEAVDSMESTSLSALATAISSTATGTDPVVDNHLADSLWDKVQGVQLRVEAAQQEARMLPSGDPAHAAATKLLVAANTLLAEASVAVQAGQFAVAVQAVAAAKDAVKTADLALAEALAVSANQESEVEVGATATVTDQLLDAPGETATHTQSFIPETTEEVLP